MPQPSVHTEWDPAQSPAIAFAPLLSSMTQHFYPNKPPNTVLAGVRRAFEEPSPLRYVLAPEFLEIVQRLRWQSVPRRFIFDPLTDITKLQTLPGSPVEMSGLLPIRIAAQCLKLVPAEAIEIEATGNVGVSCDVFVDSSKCPGSSLLPVSVLPTASGSDRRGLAFQCKAISSSNNLSKSVRKGLSQVESTDGGLLVLDISELIRKEIGDTSGLDYNTFLAKCNTAVRQIVDRIIGVINCSHVSLINGPIGIFVHSYVLGGVQTSPGLPYILFGAFRSLRYYPRTISGSAARVLDESHLVECNTSLASLCNDYECSQLVLPSSGNLIVCEHGGQIDLGGVALGGVMYDENDVRLPQDQQTASTATAFIEMKRGVDEVPFNPIEYLNQVLAEESAITRVSSPKKRMASSKSSLPRKTYKRRNKK